MLVKLLTCLSFKDFVSHCSSHKITNKGNHKQVSIHYYLTEGLCLHCFAGKKLYNNDYFVDLNVKIKKIKL